MDQKDQKNADTAAEPHVETLVELEDGDLEVVTGGMISGGGAAAPDKPVCITSIG
jgi:hypothetical protein